MAIKTSNSFFDVINDMWSKSFSDYTNETLRRMGFMINRRMSIGYPLISGYLSVGQGLEASVVKYWQKFITSKHKTKPNWFYTKTKSDEKKEKEISEDLRKAYCKKNNCTYKEFNEALSKFPKELSKELKALEEDIKLKESKSF